MLNKLAAAVVAASARTEASTLEKQKQHKFVLPKVFPCGSSRVRIRKK